VAGKAKDVAGNSFRLKCQTLGILEPGRSDRGGFYFGKKEVMGRVAPTPISNTEREGMRVSEEEGIKLARHDEQIVTLFNVQTRLDRDRMEDKAFFQGCLTEINGKLDKLANRLPLWATILISLLTAACGWLAKH